MPSALFTMVPKAIVFCTVVFCDLLYEARSIHELHELLIYDQSTNAAARDSRAGGW